MPDRLKDVREEGRDKRGSQEDISMDPKMFYTRGKHFYMHKVGPSISTDSPLLLKLSMANLTPF